MNYKDFAWLIVRKAIEEAMNRYGLTLYGRIDDGPRGVVLDFVYPQRNIGFSKTVDSWFLFDEKTAVTFFESGISPIIRRLAEERDRPIQTIYNVSF